VDAEESEDVEVPTDAEEEKDITVKVGDLSTTLNTKSTNSKELYATLRADLQSSTHPVNGECYTYSIFSIN